MPQADKIDVFVSPISRFVTLPADIAESYRAMFVRGDLFTELPANAPSVDDVLDAFTAAGVTADELKLIYNQYVANQPIVKASDTNLGSKDINANAPPKPVPPTQDTPPAIPKPQGSNAMEYLAIGLIVALIVIVAAHQSNGK